MLSDDLHNALVDACRGGQLDVVKRARAEGATDMNWTLAEACLRWGLVAACRNGHVDVAQWVYAEGAAGHASALNAARDRLMVGWLRMQDVALHNSKAAACLNLAFVCACRGGHLEIAQWAHAKGATDFRDGLVGASTFGHVTVAQWLVVEGSLDVEALNYALFIAVDAGQLPMVKWLRAEGATDIGYALHAAHVAYERQPTDMRHDIMDWVRAEFESGNQETRGV